MGKSFRVDIDNPKNWTLKEFYKNRNRVVIYRNLGGLGDILMHRMIFEDFKKIDPETELLFACPPQYFDAVKDHPFLDGVLTSKDLKIDEYLTLFNTSAACGRYESAIAPLSDKHRSDIWAEHCGIKLTTHNMHIIISDEEKKQGLSLIEKVRNKEGPTIALCPISAMLSKNLLPRHIKHLVNELHALKYFVFGVHNNPIETLIEMEVPTLTGLDIRQWMSVLYAADYIISVDTAAFHFAGGMGKPLVGIFTWADGYTYGKYSPSATIVQLHRDTHKDWTCGPCYRFAYCPLTNDAIKPCLTNISNEMLMDGVIKMISKYPK